MSEVPVERGHDRERGRQAAHPGDMPVSGCSHHEAYGFIGVVVLVLAWFLISAFSVLLGAEINAELERQTRKDTTVGTEKPAGTRGANAADTLGASAS